ncbi:28 kDa ribonucleoprotein, chloroplastic isoform X1 [Canna indica]|uniref:28 kDa ribonucleoprotein, chloroplastic isoform X1 n=1 Tax=Canna indica TaxID=4628 RepID=A0AAQ3KTK4_9LILI|nr:28 kDa ribonucleoprotein, chloroplastic isoform X1 [Canna indica]
MASTAVGSCFSATITPQFCSKLVSSDIVLRLACHRPCRVQPIAHVRESLYAPIISQNRRFPRTLAAVVQDEATAAVEEETVTDQGGEEEEIAAPQNTKLYFGNLPYNCDSAQLAGIIQEYASPELVEVLYDRDTGRSRGFAFVTMSTVEECELVINNLDGSQFGGRTLRVNFSDKPKPKEPLYPETEFKLFVGNLSWSVTSESLTEMFQKYGNLVGARVLYDGDTGRSRGYGFVCYSTKEEMDYAMEILNGEELEGRPMRISLALGKRS